MPTIIISKGMKLTGERRHLRQAMDMAISSTIASSSPPPISFKATPSNTHTGSYLLSHSCVKPPTLIIILLLTTLFLLAFFSFYLKRCYAYRHSAQSVPFRHLRRTPTSSLFGPSNPLLAHNSITLPAQGLDTKVLQTFPKLIFSALEEERKMKLPTECVICLEEFEEEETLRLLPPCGHVFHPGCIHMWLFTHTSCPLCRHSLLDNPASPQHLDGVTLQTQPSAPLRHDFSVEEAPAN